MRDADATMQKMPFAIRMRTAAVTTQTMSSLNRRKQKYVRLRPVTAVGLTPVCGRVFVLFCDF